MLIQAEVLTMPAPSLLNASAHRLRYAFTYLFCIIQKTPCLYNSKHRSTNRKVCATSPSAQGIPQQSAEGYWVPTLIFNVLKEGLHTRHPKDWSPVMVETEKFLDRIREKKNVWQTKKTSAHFHGFFLWMPLWGLSSMLWLLGLLSTACTFPLSWVDTTQRIRISAKVHPQKVTHCYRSRQVSLCPWKTLQMLQSDVNEGATDLSQTRHTVGVYLMLDVNICFCKG